MSNAQKVKQEKKLVIPQHLQHNKKPALDAEGAKEKWKTIENAIHQIYQQNASSLSFQNLYTSGYQIILHKHGDILYNGVEETITQHIVGEREKVMACAEPVFLQELLDHWEKHRTAVSMIRDILMYMDKNYVPQHKKLGVYDLGVKIFGECMLKDKKVSERVRSLTLGIIEQERNGETAPQRMLLKNLTKMMIEVSKREVYEPCLEEHFLKHSTDHYRREAGQFFASSTTPDYIRKVFKRLSEESDRVERCLDEATKPKVEMVIKTEMIAAYKQGIIEKENSGCLRMLLDWKVDDMRLLYECLKLIDDIQCMVLVIKDYLLQHGTKFVMDTENNQQPLNIIDGVMQMRDHYTELLQKAFLTDRDGPKPHVDKTFETAITKAFEEIVNKNTRFPEYLSLYVDSKLRKGKTQLPDEEYDAIFDKVLTLFRYLREKDVFEKYYKNHLAKRLLHQKSTSDDAERSFITKLKTEYGYQFTSKLEGMFQDMKLSQEKNEMYKQHCAMADPKPPCEILVQVLTTTWWPLPTTNNITLPPVMEQAAQHFKAFYLRQHNGRKLQYQYNMGNVDVRFRTPSSKMYELNVSTHQMVILMLYNNAKCLSLADILAETSITPQDLKRALFSLCHASSKTHSPLLKKEAGSSEDTTKYTFNADFKSRFIKVKISQMVHKETEDEAKETRSKVDEDRKWQLDAVIVRVMKSRRAMEHRQLVADVIDLLKGRFQPSPDDIKKRIESLIEREYMERSQQSRSKYNYLA
jgi:cullin 3|mmetsp:Transcript_52290/g.87289  ORF Transcript_52290/g.87289 Transcript_52290/m.87289 type:complete len:752 (-) Transcript_52290:3066-5321(-)